jgi:hypothetical protein
MHCINRGGRGLSAIEEAKGKDVSYSRGKGMGACGVLINKRTQAWVLIAIVI